MKLTTTILIICKGGSLSACKLKLPVIARLAQKLSSVSMIGPTPRLETEVRSEQL